MNQIYFNSDPLLNSVSQSNQGNPYRPDPYVIQQIMNQNMMDNNGGVQKDWINELDTATMNLDESVVSQLTENQEYIKLSDELKGMIQSELMSFVKQKLNSYPSVVDNIKKQLNIIKETSAKAKEEEKRNISELNEYMKNYSHMSFDDYKKIKDKKK